MLQQHPLVSGELGHRVGEQDVVPMFLAQTLRSPVGAPPPFEETASGLVGRHLFLGGVELSGGQFFGARFIRDYALLDLLVVAT